jgi:hypothetical protein
VPRSLTIHRTVVTPADRERWFERVRARERHFKAAGCRYWVFEEQALPGAFVEFCEANDAPALTAAHAASPDPILDPTRIYSIVELA